MGTRQYCKYVIIVVFLDGITNTDKNNITIQRVWPRAKLLRPF